MQTLYNRPKHLNKEVAENVTDEESSDLESINLTLRQEQRNPHMAEHDIEPIHSLRKL